MQTRKVQLSGGTTYTVSLPKSWATEHGIASGSELTLHPNDDGSLLVEPSEDVDPEDRRARVDISSCDRETVGELIRAAYTVGIDTVTLVDRTGHSFERQQAIEEVLGGLSGFEVMETTDTRVRITSLVDAGNVDIRKSTLRLRLVMLAMHRDAVTAVLERDEALARRLVRRDHEADKLFAMITRHYRRSLSNLHEVAKLDRSRDELFEYYYTARQLERVADHAEKIARLTVDPGVVVSDKYGDRIAELGKRARTVVDNAADVVLEGADVDAAVAALEAREEVIEDIESFDRDLYRHDDANEACCLGLLLDSLQRTADYGANIAEVGLEQEIRTTDTDD
jgi:phosphate uptake regulator